jgi:hypothetical protein
LAKTKSATPLYLPTPHLAAHAKGELQPTHHFLHFLDVLGFFIFHFRFLIQTRIFQPPPLLT